MFMLSSDTDSDQSLFLLMPLPLSTRKEPSAGTGFRANGDSDERHRQPLKGNIMYKQKSPTLIDWLFILARLAPIIMVYLWPTFLRFILGTVFFVALAALMYHLVDVEPNFSAHDSSQQVAPLTRER